VTAVGKDAGAVARIQDVADFRFKGSADRTKERGEWRIVRGFGNGRAGSTDVAKFAKIVLQWISGHFQSSRLAFSHFNGDASAYAARKPSHR
jgi:hypothetical protein